MDELEAILGKPDWKPPKDSYVIPKRITTPPDALVLINLTTVCGCGEKFSTPNKRLMLRFGENFIGMKQEIWRAEYNDLPREVRVVETKVLTCPQCFHKRFIHECGLLTILTKGVLIWNLDVALQTLTEMLAIRCLLLSKIRKVGSGLSRSSG